MRFSLLTAALLVMMNLNYPISVEAANEDDELSIMAAEQRVYNDADVTVRDDIETFDNSSSKLSNNNKPVVENKKTVNASTKNNNVINKIETENINNVIEDKPKIEEATNNTPINNPVDNVNAPENLPNNVGMPNPIVSYSNFEEAARKVGYIPLYVPRKSGFAMSHIEVIGGNIVEIRYGRRWEPTVTLSIRTYKRSPGEELKDISGVQGVKWKIDLSTGMTIYIARVSNNVNAAAWSVGQYTFAAMTENLSFAAFHAFIVEELVDLCNHYFIDI